MSLVTFNEILPQARREKRAVGAFNVANYEGALGALRAAEAEKLPIIIQVYMRLFNSEKGADLGGTLLRLAQRCNQPVVIHLDHGETVEQVQKALDAGYSSVMYDGSRLPFEENLRITAQAAELAHQKGASMEGEIGHVAQGDESVLTRVDEAVEFAQRTAVDALAVSIGTAHGYYQKTPRIDIERCRELSEALPVLPFVLHGGTGTPLEEVRKAIQHGICKVNIATEYMDTFLKSTRRELEKLDGKFLPIDKFMDPVVDDCAAHAARLLRFFAGK
ncbi:MAG: class II fructose-bisphosphate aldolase [Lentisphaeria bacterium]